MKLQNKYVSKKIGKKYIVVPVGDDVEKRFNGIISLNETGYFLFKKLEKGVEMNELVDDFAKEYGLEKDFALSEIETFLTKLKKASVYG